MFLSLLCLKTAWVWKHLHAPDKSPSTARYSDMRWGARARSSLLAALIRARAPTGAKPYCNSRNSSLLLLLLLFFRNKRIFEGLNVHEKLLNFAHTSEVVKNLIFYGSRKKAGQNGSIAPPRKSGKLSPSIQIVVGERNSVCICIMTRRTKKSLGHIL